MLVEVKVKTYQSPLAHLVTKQFNCISNVKLLNTTYASYIETIITVAKGLNNIRKYMNYKIRHLAVRLYVILI